MIKKSKSVGNESKKDYVKELKYKTYENTLNNYVPKETIQQHFEYNGYQRKKERIFPRAQDEGDKIKLGINNNIENETILKTHLNRNQSILEDKSFLDTIKDFFRNFAWPSCCKCNEIKNEEINEINTNTIKTPLNARNKSSI